MIKLEVTGATPEEFAQNAMSAWGLLAIGLHRALQPRTDAEEMSGSESSSTASKAAAEPAPQVSPPATPPSSTASSPPPKPTVTADGADDLFMGQKTADPAPEVAGTKASSTEKKTKGPKLDDLKTRLSEVIVAATERWDQKRANAYARKLLHEWRAPKLSDLAPDQYEIFMRVSESYLDGTAAE